MNTYGIEQGQLTTDDVTNDIKIALLSIADQVLLHGCSLFREPKYYDLIVEPGELTIASTTKEFHTEKWHYIVIDVRPSELSAS